jgi:hypothetical protein
MAVMLTQPARSNALSPADSPLYWMWRLFVKLPFYIVSSNSKVDYLQLKAGLFAVEKWTGMMGPWALNRQRRMEAPHGSAAQAFRR